MIDCLQKIWWDKKCQAGGFEPGTYVELSLGALPATVPGQDALPDTNFVSVLVLTH